MAVNGQDDVDKATRENFLRISNDYNRLHSVFNFPTEVVIQLSLINTLANLTKNVQTSFIMNFDPLKKSTINEDNMTMQVIVQEADAGAKINEVTVKEGSRVKIDKSSSMEGVTTAIALVFKA